MTFFDELLLDPSLELRMTFCDELLLDPSLELRMTLLLELLDSSVVSMGMIGLSSEDLSLHDIEKNATAAKKSVAICLAKFIFSPNLFIPNINSISGILRSMF